MDAVLVVGGLCLLTGLLALAPLFGPTRDQTLPPTASEEDLTSSGIRGVGEIHPEDVVAVVEPESEDDLTQPYSHADLPQELLRAPVPPWPF